MSSAGSFSLDMTDFDKRMLKISANADKIIRNAMWEAAAALKKDCDEIFPKTPHLHGNLRGNARRSVKAKGSSAVRKDWWPKRQWENKGPVLYSIIIAFLAPYAARWHETDEAINWSEDGVGAKYMEAKMARKDLRDKYYGLIALRIKQEIAAEMIAEKSDNENFPEAA